MSNKQLQDDIGVPPPRDKMLRPADPIRPGQSATQCVLVSDWASLVNTYHNDNSIGVVSLLFRQGDSSAQLEDKKAKGREPDPGV